MADILDRNPPCVRDATGRFVKGSTGNPGGITKRFKGLAAYIRTQTDDGRELADFALDVMRNREGVYKHVDRWDAMRWLADRGFGKPVATTVEISGEAPPDLPDLRDLTDEQLDALDETIGKIFAEIEK